MLDDSNPYESPRDTSAPRSRTPWIIGLVFSLAVWLFMAAMMWLQYHDEAAHYMPRWTMRSAGYAVVAGGVVLSSVYLWRVVRERDPFRQT